MISTCFFKDNILKSNNYDFLKVSFSMMKFLSSKFSFINYFNALTFYWVKEVKMDHKIKLFYLNIWVSKRIILLVEFIEIKQRSFSFGFAPHFSYTFGNEENKYNETSSSKYKESDSEEIIFVSQIIGLT